MRVVFLEETDVIYASFSVVYHNRMDEALFVFPSGYDPFLARRYRVV